MLTVIPAGDVQHSVRFNMNDMRELISNGKRRVYFWSHQVTNCKGQVRRHCSGLNDSSVPLKAASKGTRLATGSDQRVLFDSLPRSTPQRTASSTIHLR